MKRVELGGESFALAGDPALSGRAAELAGKIPHNTERVYIGHIERFGRFCVAEGLDPWDPAVGAQYLAALWDANGSVPITLRQCATALRAAYRCTGRSDDHPSWVKVIKGAQKEWVERGSVSGEALPLRMATLHAMVRALVRPLSTLPRARALRDRALLLTAWSAGMRSAEVMALDVDDMTAHDEGLMVRVRGSKMNRTTVEFAKLPVREERATCPLAAWRDWVDARPASFVFEGEPAWLTSGRSGRIHEGRLAGEHAVERIIARALEAADIDDPGYTSHSLRAGIATELAERGVPLPSIANVGRWKSLNSVLRYARREHSWGASALHALEG